MKIRKQTTNWIRSAVTILALFLSGLTVCRVIAVSHTVGGLYTFGIFYLAVFAGIYSIIKGALFFQGVFFSVWVRGALALTFTGFQVAGLYLSMPGIEEAATRGEAVLWAVCLAPLTYGAQNMLFAWVSGCAGRTAGREKKSVADKGRFSFGRNFGFSFAVILAGFLIPFAAYYPAIMAYDVIPQLNQIKISGYTTHHPLIHTLMLAFCLRLGQIFPLVQNADRAGLAIYSVLQMTIVAGCFAYVYAYMRRKGVHRYVCYLFALCAAFYPTHGMLAVSITKDTIYAALVMLFTVFVWELATWEQAAPPGKTWTAAYTILTVLLLLFRNNSIYAWILYLAAMSAALYGKSGGAEGTGRLLRRRVCLIHAASFVLYLLISMGMTTAVRATSDTYAREMLSVPAQQIARVVAYHEEELTELDRERLSAVWGEETLPEYVPAIADRSKKDIPGDRDALKALAPEWAGLGLRYPGDYIKAFMIKNKGMWYLEDSSYLFDVYSYAKGYLQITYPSDQQEYMQTLLPGYERHQKLQFLQAVYRYFAGGDALWRYLPPLALIMQPAFYCWLLFYYCVCCIGLKKMKWLLPAVYLAALAGTLLLGPCVLVRYLYPVMLSVTVLALLALTALRAGQRS